MYTSLVLYFSIFALSMEQTRLTFHCWLYNLCIVVYVTNKTWNLKLDLMRHEVKLTFESDVPWCLPTLECVLQRQHFSVFRCSLGHGEHMGRKTHTNSPEAWHIVSIASFSLNIGQCEKLTKIKNTSLACRLQTNWLWSSESVIRRMIASLCFRITDKLHWRCGLNKTQQNAASFRLYEIYMNSETQRLSWLQL